MSPHTLETDCVKPPNINQSAKFCDRNFYNEIRKKTNFENYLFKQNVANEHFYKKYFKMGDNLVENNDLMFLN